jgi:hypothetical protein
MVRRVGAAQRPRRAASAALCAALSLACACAGARTRGPEVVVPSRGRGAPPPRDLSRGGTDRGDIEIALGAVTTAVAATLVVLGSLGARRTAQLREYCAQPPILTTIEVYRAACEDLSGVDPVTASTVSTVLSFTFAVPIAVGGAFLLRKGVRIRRDHRKATLAVPKDMSLRPWVEPGRGAGVGLGFSF